MKRVLLHHIPKTAGSSLIHMIPRAQGTHEPYGYKDVRRRARRMIEITMLREPVARVCSWLDFISRPNDILGQRLRGRPAVDLLAEQSPITKIWTDERMVRQLGGDWMPTKPQPPMDEQLDKAKEVLDSMFWVGITELFDEQRPDLMEALHLEDPGDVWMNVSRHKADIDDRAIDLIEELTEWDRKLYEYALASGPWRRDS